MSCPSPPPFLSYFIWISWQVLLEIWAELYCQLLVKYAFYFPALPLLPWEVRNTIGSADSWGVPRMAYGCALRSSSPVLRDVERTPTSFPDSDLAVSAEWCVLAFPAGTHEDVISGGTHFLLIRTVHWSHWGLRCVPCSLEMRLGTHAAAAMFLHPPGHWKLLWSHLEPQLR